MNTLVLGMAVFFGAHSISIANRPWRDAMAKKLGEGAWKGAYSLASLGGFVLLCIGYAAARADPVILYAPPVALRHIAMLLMLPVFPLMFAVYLPGHLKARAKHPLLAGTKLWATAHLFANGTLADALLFGGFLAWAIAVRVSLKRRGGPVSTPGPHALRNDAIAIIGGLAVYAAFIAGLHGWLFGVNVL